MCKCFLKRKFYDSYQFNTYPHIHIYIRNKQYNNNDNTHKQTNQKSFTKSTKIDIHMTITIDPMIVIGQTIDII